MSDIYDFELTANLKLDVPNGVVDFLKYLFVVGAPYPAKPPDDPFFSGEYWKRNRYCEMVTEDTAYAGIGVCALRHRPCRYNSKALQYTVHLRIARRLEEVIEVDVVFAEWLARWCDQDEYVGYFKGERAKHPHLLYFHDEMLHCLEVKQPPQNMTTGSLWE